MLICVSVCRDLAVPHPTHLVMNNKCQGYNTYLTVVVLADLRSFRSKWELLQCPVKCFCLYDRFFFIVFDLTKVFSWRRKKKHALIIRCSHDLSHTRVSPKFINISQYISNKLAGIRTRSDRVTSYSVP